MLSISLILLTNSFGQNISTVGTNQDYLTLQLWEDWADDQTNYFQWAECFRGSDLGGVIIDGWQGRSLTAYPKIYASTSQRHDGTLSYDSAYLEGAIQIGEQYTVIEGMKVISTGQEYGIGSSDPLSDLTIDGNLIFCEDGGWQSGIFCYGPSGLLASNIVIRNNIIYGTNALDFGIYITGAFYIAPADVDAYIYNNTIVDCDAYGIFLEGGEQLEPPLSGIMNIYATNNIVFDSGTDFYADGTGTQNLYGGYNLSSDETGDDWGATGSLTGKTATAQFLGTTTNWRLKATADAWNAGDTLEDFYWDAFRDPRPQDGAWSMGALEGYPSYGAPSGMVN